MKGEKKKTLSIWLSHWLFPFLWTVLFCVLLTFSKGFVFLDSLYSPLFIKKMSSWPISSQFFICCLNYFFIFCHEEMYSFRFCRFSFICGMALVSLRCCFLIPIKNFHGFSFSVCVFSVAVYTFEVSGIYLIVRYKIWNQLSFFQMTSQVYQY